MFKKKIVTRILQGSQRRLHWGALRDMGGKNVLESPACVLQCGSRIEHYIFPPRVFPARLQKALSSHRYCLDFSKIENDPYPRGKLPYFPL